MTEKMQQTAHDNSEARNMTKYRCRYGHTKWIPGERPLTPNPSIRTGCRECESLREFRPVGSSVAAQWGGRR